MNDKELERLKDLESIADSCILEICDILDDDQYYNSWYNISDGITDKIAELEAIAEFKKSENNS